MKNGIVILFALLLLASCSKDDGSSSIPKTYGVTVEKICRGSQTTYCVSKTTYDNVVKGIQVGDPCQYIYFTDIDNNSIRGYFRRAGSSCVK